MDSNSKHQQQITINNNTIKKQFFIEQHQRYEKINKLMVEYWDELEKFELSNDEIKIPRTEKQIDELKTNCEIVVDKIDRAHNDFTEIVWGEIVDGTSGLTAELMGYDSFE